MVGGKSEGFPSMSHEETAVPERCSDAGYPPAAWHEDRICRQKEQNLQVCAWEPRERLQEEQKSE